MAKHIKLNEDQVKTLIIGGNVALDVNCPEYGDDVYLLLTADCLDIQKNPRDEAKKIKFVGGMEVCPECSENLGFDYHGRQICYCLKCGQKIVRGE